ncbi:glutathione S-transferase [Cylindrobasidium torrendii FP15055 ss-10]|uniref:glutathione transferase n=1 Tax=Cylindrobasidium torrendii FP15055 ss-10 TaxID=1314674 RepID=A0A0D7BKF0_9AGAR|nr:glutathione S-transferase [Cylindrobasidium torrendii FP15055 ss-10]
MVLKLYGWTRSIATKRAAIILHEKQVPFEFVDVDIFKGEHKLPEYIAKQPFGEVPYLDDDGFVVFESRAIARYIAIKYAHRSETPALIPPTTELIKTAKFEQAASIEITSFEPYASVYCTEKVAKRLLFNIEGDMQKAEAAYIELVARINVYDKLLGETRYLAGEEVTLVDLFHIPWGEMLTVAGGVLDLKPNVNRWWTDISSRASVVAVQDGAKTIEKY